MTTERDEPAPATAVEIARAEAHRAAVALWQGVCLGVAAMAIAVHALLTRDLGDLRRTFETFGGTPPLGTVITLSDAWRWGVIGAGAAAVAALAWRRPRGVAWYAAVALGLVAAMLATYWFPTAPLRDLAGTIKD